MGRPGSALDNAVIESWHSTVEFELRRLEHFPTKTQARAQVAAWIEEYNHDRRSLGLAQLLRDVARPATRPVLRQISRVVVLVAGSRSDACYERGDQGAGVPGEAAVRRAVLDGAR